MSAHRNHRILSMSAVNDRDIVSGCHTGMDHSLIQSYRMNIHWYLADIHYYYIYMYIYIILLHPALNSWNHLKPCFEKCFSGTLEILFFHRDLPSLGDLVEQFRLLVQRHGLQTHPFVKPPSKKSLRKGKRFSNLMKWFSIWNKLGNIS